MQASAKKADTIFVNADYKLRNIRKNWRKCAHTYF